MDMQQVSALVKKAITEIETKKNGPRWSVDDVQALCVACHERLVSSTVKAFPPLVWTPRSFEILRKRGPRVVRLHGICEGQPISHDVRTRYCSNRRARVHARQYLDFCIVDLKFTPVEPVVTIQITEVKSE